MRAHGKMSSGDSSSGDIYSFSASKAVAAAEMVASIAQSQAHLMQQSLNPFDTMPPSTASGRPATGSTGARPMTSMRGAGYSSQQKNATPGGSSAFDPLGLSSSSSSTPAPPLLSKQSSTPESQCRDIERQIHGCLEAAARAGNAAQALEQAKEAAKRERALAKMREKYSLTENASHELSFAVLLTLAHAYTRCALYEEALQTYAAMVRSRAPSTTAAPVLQPARLRVNMGNIYFQQGNYAQAIKMYRMCMDALPAAQKDLRAKIQRNVAVSFLKLGQYQDAIHTLEAIMDAGVTASAAFPSALVVGAGDVQSGFDLVVCYYALGDKEKMKKGFISLLQTPELLSLNEEEEEEEREMSDAQALEATLQDGSAVDKSNFSRTMLLSSSDSLFALPFNDGLSQDRRARRRHLQRCLLTAARLIAPHIESPIAAGYDWVISALRKPKCGRASAHALDELAASKAGFPVTAMHLLLAKGIAYIHSNELSSAIEVFRSFHNTYSIAATSSSSAPSSSSSIIASSSSSDHLIDHAAVNLSFLYFLEKDYEAASKYADLAVKHDRYNARALVNKANVLFALGAAAAPGTNSVLLLEQAKELYLESIGVEADCCEAIFNLGVVNEHLGLSNDSLQAFRKLHKLAPHDREVLWHLGRAHEREADKECDERDTSASEREKERQRGEERAERERAREEAIHYFHTLHSAMPSDPSLLAKLGTLYSRSGDETAAFHCFHDSFELLPLNFSAISWLGVWYVKNEMFDEAIKYFVHADLMESNSFSASSSSASTSSCKWKLMIASCYRRLGDRHKASKLYEAILKIDNENLEALRYLCAMAKEIGNTRELEQWNERLQRIERNNKAALKNEREREREKENDPSFKEIGGEQEDVGHVRPPKSSPHISPRQSSTIAAAPIKAGDPTFKHDLGPERVRKTVNSNANREDDEDEFGDTGADDLLPL